MIWKKSRKIYLPVGTSRDKFFAEGDACTSYFFRKFKKRRSRTTLTKLKDKDGVLTEDQKDISRLVQDNFTLLYSAKSQSSQERSAVDLILQDSQRVVSPQQAALLQDEPSERELLDSLLLLPSGKSPGPDGMGTEVMRILWPFIGGLYFRAVLELWASGSLLPYYKDGLISLLPKEDSVANVLLLLRLVELASGGKANILKSKVLMLGKCRRFPAWLSGIGLKLVDKRDVTVYLGAPLTTVWHGSDNGDNLLGRLEGKAEFFAATSLSFEFKKRTLKSFDQLLHEYVWSTDVDGRKKQSLSAWDSLIMPVSGGGLGVFSAEDFQTALISRSILKALQDPDASL
ncbi:hypothetical protein R1sor_017984 [Riccia sorocarpa]|uniref:Uncharacterized protein n=1 Tax=Riccia sorocarpa TaxID=122646 RepID=A0ABD3I8J2_9MARC